MADGNSKAWLIVGASRGIGHEFAAQLLNRGDDVFVTVRKPGKEHNVAYWTDAKVDASHCTTLDCDVLSEKSIDVGTRSPYGAGIEVTIIRAVLQI